MRPQFACCLVFLALSNYVHGARILGLFPHTGRSHQMVFEPLLQKLAERGHHLTVTSFFPLKNPPANYTDVSFEGIARIGLETIDLNWYENPRFILRIPIIGRIYKQITDILPLAEIALSVCSKAIDWPPLIEALNKEYDVVLVENFNSDCMIGLLHVYQVKAPVIALLTSNTMPWSAERIGATDNPSYVPLITAVTAFNSQMSFLERIENTFLKIFFTFWYRQAVQMKEQAMIEKHYGIKIPELGGLAKNISLMLINTHHALNGARPLVPGLVEVGGMHLNPTRKVIPEKNLGIPQSTVQLIVKRNKYHTYHVQRVQALLPAKCEPSERTLVRFCREMLRRHRQDPQFFNKVLWTDESNFRRMGIFNIHNLHFYSRVNPHCCLATALKNIIATPSLPVGVVRGD